MSWGKLWGCNGSNTDTYAGVRRGLLSDGEREACLIWTCSFDGVLRRVSVQCAAFNLRLNSSVCEHVILLCYSKKWCPIHITKKHVCVLSLSAVNLYKVIQRELPVKGLRTKLKSHRVQVSVCVCVHVPEQLSIPLCMVSDLFISVWVCARKLMYRPAGNVLHVLKQKSRDVLSCFWSTDGI